MRKRNLNRLFTGIILAGVLGISCPEMEQLAIVTAQAEANSQEGTTPSDKTTVTTAPLQSSVTWKKKGGKRYCYRNGRKLTGFQQIDGAWYYFNSKGVMCTGWQHIGNHYRYFSKKTGKMRVNTTIQGRKINSKGIWTPVVVLDPGHTGVVAGGYEPLGPGSSEMKAKDTSGTEGIATGVAEYQLTLKVAKQLSTALKKQGCKVVMTRTNSKNPLSCIQRAKAANKAKADAYLRIHANGSSNSSTNGAMTICVTKNNRFVSSKLYEKSYALSQSVLDAYVKATGCHKEYIWQTDTMTGNNWSKVPTTLIEMGYMSNPTEDRKMQTKAYQKKMVKGMAEGIKAYFLG
nr:N-acetylmuramoyl-L-alanine amidase [uncultured Blautia sp.]